MSEAGSRPQAAEEEALGALRDGDYHAVLEALMGAYGREIYRYCRMMIGDGERAHDVLQKTFVQAHGGLARFRGQSSLRTWLYSIARHRCLDEARASRRWGRRATDLDSVSEVLPDGAVGPERRVLDAEKRRLLARCLGELAPRVRDAVVQRYMEGLSYDEMSQVTEERAGTLRVRIARAMPVLRQCLEAAGLTG